MRLMSRKELLRSFLKWAEWALFACAVPLIAYCGFALVDSWRFQRRAGRDLERLVHERRAPIPAALQPEAQGLIGRIEIPRLKLSVVIIEGVNTTTLRRGVGHIPGTALPGDAGNVGLAGHRDTFFRPLKDLKIKDEIRVSTLKGIFTYQIVSLRVVEPEDVGVLAPSDENVLTLVTCYPFYFVGSAPQRWIVRARQMSSPTLASSNVK